VQAIPVVVKRNVAILHPVHLGGAAAGVKGPENSQEDSDAKTRWKGIQKR
jgi:hypothetical protein